MQMLYDWFGTSNVEVATRILSIVIILLLMGILIRVLQIVFSRAERRMKAEGKDISVLRYLRYGAKSLVYVFGISGALWHVPGLDTMMTGILAGSGILAIVVGFASQQALGNIVNGVILLIFRPFQIGDKIQYHAIGVTSIGVVEEIGFRHTAIRTEEGSLVLIPNSLMNSNVVEVSKRA